MFPSRKINNIITIVGGGCSFFFFNVVFFPIELHKFRDVSVFFFCPIHCLRRIGEMYKNKYLLSAGRLKTEKGVKYHYKIYVLSRGDNVHTRVIILQRVC